MPCSCARRMLAIDMTEALAVGLRWFWGVKWDQWNSGLFRLDD